MKLAIGIPAFGRLECLANCLNSIATNWESEDADVWVYPDAIDDEELGKMHEVFSDSGLSGGVKKPAPRRLYGSGNIVRSLRETMAMGYERMISLEADLILSPFYLKQILAASKWSNAPATSPIACLLPLSKKQKLSRKVYRNHQASGSNFVLTMKQWKLIEPLVVEYTELFLDVPPNKRDNGACRQWYSAKAQRLPPDHVQDLYVRGEIGTTVDGAIRFALLNHGIPVHSLVINRLIHSTESGENSNPVSDSFYADTQLDILDGDSAREDFEWFKNEDGQE